MHRAKALIWSFRRSKKIEEKKMNQQNAKKDVYTYYIYLYEESNRNMERQK